MKKRPSDEDIYARMFEALSYFGQLSPELRAAIIERAPIRDFRKKELILKRGQVNRFVYFSFYGLVRGFFETEKKEITDWFMDTGDIFIWPISFFKQVPSVGTIVAMEDVITVELSFENYKWLIDNFPQFKVIDDLAWKHYYFKTQERIEMKGYTGKENYIRLCERHPRVIEIAKVEDIASYFGISRQALTKIRRELKK